MDFEKTVVATFIFLLLGGSFLAALWAVEATLLPAAFVMYVFVGFAFLRRLKQAEKIG